MKLIILVRHATAEERGIEADDFNRSLIKKGRKESKKMAKVFNRYQINPGIWISSPAPRAMETASIFADTFKYPVGKVLQEEKLYNDNTANVYQDLIHTMPDDQQSVIFFGHDPAISDFAAQLLQNFDLGFQKSGVIIIAHLTTSWKEIKENSGFLTALEFPKSDRRADQLLKNAIKRLFTTHYQQLFSVVYPKHQKNLLETVNATGEKIAKKILKELRNN